MKSSAHPCAGRAACHEPTNRNRDYVMRIRLGVCVGCMLFLAYGSRAEDGKSKQSVPESGTPVSKASDSHRMDTTALLPAVSEVCGYRSPDEWRDRRRTFQ